jgi:predicted nucleotidyltransferase
MDLNRPLGVITPLLEAGILSVLAGADETFTTQQINQIIGKHSEKAIRTALQRLCDQGAVLKEQKGPLGLYRLNRHHLAAPYIIGLANIKSDLLNKITKVITRWEIEPVFAAMFGSAARGEMRLDSDIDIFMVRPDRVAVDDLLWFSLTSELAENLRKWTGNDARILELSESELERGLATKEPVLADIEEQGLMLHGDRSKLRRPSQTQEKGLPGGH